MPRDEYPLASSVCRLVYATDRVHRLVMGNYPVPMDRLGIELCGVESMTKNLRSLIREKGPMEAAPNTVLSRVQVVEQDTRKATGLYGRGDRSDFVLRILAVGKRAYDEDGLRMPRPTSVTAEEWDKVLAGLPEPPSREGKPEDEPSTVAGQSPGVPTCLPQEWRQAVAARETTDGYWEWAPRRWREVKAAKVAG